MSELAPPNQIRSGPPTGPTREVKRVARMRDHEADGQTAAVNTRPEHEPEGHGSDEPAVVVSHPAAAVAEGEEVTGHVVELTPRDQPVLQAGNLRLLLDVRLPLPLNTEMCLTIMEVQPGVTARIDAVNGEQPHDAPLVPVMVLALSSGEVTTPAPAPTSYADNPALMRARMMRDNDEVTGE